MSVRERFFEVFEDLKKQGELTSYTELAKVIHTNKAGVSDLKAGRKKISLEHLDYMKNSYPSLNLEWIITGEGEKKKPKHKALYPVSQDDPDGIPLIPIDAMAGFAAGDVSVLDLDCERYVVPAFKGADYLITIKGSSMYPKYSSGDIAACKVLPIKDIFFQWNKVYVIDTIQGPLVKRIKKNGDKTKITLVSDNPDYEPFEIMLSQVRAVALVMGVIRLE